MNKNLYKFYIGCGRQGDLEGIFLETPENIELTKDRTVCFGDVLGKHSEVEAYLDDCLTLVTSDPTVIKIVEEFGLEAGFNPFEYGCLDQIADQIEDEELEGED